MRKQDLPDWDVVNEDVSDQRLSDQRLSDQRLANQDLPRQDSPRQDAGFDYHRYHRLLSEAVDEDSRRALIDVLIEEKAKDRLAAQRASDRAAMTARTIANVLRSGRH
jgi:hypothetical protein